MQGTLALVHKSKWIEAKKDTDQKQYALQMVRRKESEPSHLLIVQRKKKNDRWLFRLRAAR